jgi:hypothetical protein
MATIKGPVQGVLNVQNTQGNYLEVPMEFNSMGLPLDLTDFVDIRMEIKKSYNVNEPAFLVFTVGSGLTISGAGNNILTYILDNDFWLSQNQKWVYDITFETSDGKRFTYIKGSISNVLTASKT